MSDQKINYDILNESSDDESMDLEKVDKVDKIDKVDKVDDYDRQIAVAINQILELNAPPVNHPVARQELVEIIEFDEKNNVLNSEVRESFKNENIYDETWIFTKPISTTNTVEGYLSNVSFHERDLIPELIPDENIVIYRCNYGKHIYPGYTEPVKVKKTNRGRKKKEKKKKLRKKQGNGNDFSSQTTFIVRSRTEKLNWVENIGKVRYGAKVYKFKIFRTGKIQLPGVHPHSIEDVIECTKDVVGSLNFYLHPGEQNHTKLTRIININPVMKNYKFVIKMPEGHIIDQNVLKKIIAAEQIAQWRPKTQITKPEHPPIFMIKYTRQDTKLSIKFTTPIFKKPKKKTRVNIFMRGKINILGGFDAGVSRQICEYLHWLIECNYDKIIVPECCVYEIPWVENISVTDEEVVAMKRDFENINLYATLPSMTDLEYNQVMKFIDDSYQEKINSANEYLRDLLGDHLDAVLAY